MKIKFLAVALCAIFGGLAAWAQCMVAAPAPSSVQLAEMVVLFLPDAGCVGYAIAQVPLAVKPLPGNYTFNGARCTAARQFAQQAVLTDFGLGDGGTP